MDSTFLRQAKIGLIIIAKFCDPGVWLLFTIIFKLYIYIFIYIYSYHRTSFNFCHSRNQRVYRIHSATLSLLSAS